jgi:MFS family permease
MERPPIKTATAWSVVAALSVTQIVSWGSLFYAFSVLLGPIERDTGWPRSSIVGAFSLSLLVTGLASVPAGAAIDRFGGRVVMSIGSIIAVVALLLLTQAGSIALFYACWLAIGIAAAMLLYEPAFAVLYRTFAEPRKAVTALTLTAGFASTIFWPLTHALVARLGWRDTVLALAVMNGLLCLPLHAFALPGRAALAPRRVPGASKAAIRDRGWRAFLRMRPFWLLALAFTAYMLPFAVLSVHLIPLLQEKGFSGADAVLLAALVGPMQVAGRIAEFTVGRRFATQRVGMLAIAALPLAIAVLALAPAGAGAVVVFVVLYGASNGVVTIVRATLPAELFGREHYGALNGALAAPVILTRAAGPLLASLVWSTSAGYDPVVGMLAAAGVIAVVAFRMACSAEADRRNAS